MKSNTSAPSIKQQRALLTFTEAPFKAVAGSTATRHRNMRRKAVVIFMMMENRENAMWAVFCISLIRDDHGEMRWILT